MAGSVRSRLVRAVTRSIRPGRPSPPVHVEFTEEHDALRTVVRDFAEAEIAPHAEAWDRDHHFPVDVVRGDGRARAVRHPVPRGVRRRRRRPHHAVHRHRGAGPGRPLDGDHARGGRRARAPTRSTGSAPRSRSSVAARPVRRPHARRLRAHRAGGRQRRRRHPHDGGARRGDGRVGDQRREGVHHQLGHRHHRRSSRSRPAPGPGEISTIIVPVGHARASRCSRRTGRWAGTRPTPTGSPSPTAACPEANLLGERGRGLRPVPRRSSTRAASPSPRSPSAAIQACLEHCTRYAQDRHAFGQPIGANQGVAFKCADLAVMAETARLLTYQAAWLHDTGRPFKQAAAMAKLHTTEAAVTRHPRGHPDLRRLRVHRRDAGGPLLPRRQDPRDRRGHERDPAPRDQPRAGPARSE